MTDYVNPGAANTPIAPLAVAESFRHAGVKGWIVPPTDSPTAIAEFEAGDAGITTSNLTDAFDAVWSDTSLDVRIQAGEGFIAGYLTRDTETIITLPENTTTTIELGWDASALDSDVVIIASDTDVSWDPEDPRLPIWEFETDADGVVSATDRRPLGPEEAQGIVTFGRQEARNEFVDQQELDTHRNSTSNPHDVTATQAGALPLAGGTMSGDINTDGNMLRSSSALGDGDEFIYVEGENNDPIVFRFGYSRSFGFQFQYTGSGTGNANAFDLFTDNQDQSGRNWVWEITQDAQVDFKNQASKQGNPLVSAESEYEIQKNGSDGTGIINFKT